jgi:hypothetical protein
VPDLTALALTQQDALFASEERLQHELAQAYQEVAARLDKDIARLVGKIEAARNAGEKVTETWLFGSQLRLRRLQVQVESELEKYGVLIEDRVTGMQAEAVRMAQGHAQELMRLGLGSLSHSFTGLPREAVRGIVGKLAHNSEPLATALSKYPQEASAAIRKQLVIGVALGHSPRKVASELSKVVGGKAGDYLTLAATEVVSAHRNAGLEVLKQNRDIVDGWEWLLGKSDACPFCVSKTGRVYSLDTPFDTHPRCKCTAIPSLKGA